MTVFSSAGHFGSRWVNLTDPRTWEEIRRDPRIFKGGIMPRETHKFVDPDITEGMFMMDYAGVKRRAYGKEFILDIHKCDVSLFNRKSLTEFFRKLCDDILKMERCDLHFWDYEGVPDEDIPTEPHLRGTTAIQFISTSNVTIHTLDLLGAVYLNIFSCKNFHEAEAMVFCRDFFQGSVARYRTVDRLWPDEQPANPILTPAPGE